MTRFSMMMVAGWMGVALGAGCGEPFSEDLFGPDGGTSSGEAGGATSSSGDQGGGTTGSGGATSTASSSGNTTTTGSGGSTTGSGGSTTTGSGGGATTGSGGSTTTATSSGSGGGSSTSATTGSGGASSSSGAGGASSSSSGTGGGPVCSEGTYSCDANGVSPLVCQNGAWASAGGDCTYGCDSNGFGTCSCSAPSGRLTLNETGNGAELTDSVTGYTWVRLKGCFNLADCQTKCAALNGVLPTMSQVETLLSEETLAAECHSADADPLVGQMTDTNTGAGVTANYMTCTMPGGGLGFQFLNWSDGTITCIANPGSSLCLVP